MRPPSSRGPSPGSSRLATRWSDNDAYGHLNNVVYYALFDSAVNAILIEAGLLDPATSPIIGLVVESSCRFYSSLTYPEPADVGVAVEHLGRSSVRYHLAVFKAGAADRRGGWPIHPRLRRAGDEPPVSDSRRASAADGRAEGAARLTALPDRSRLILLSRRLPLQFMDNCFTKIRIRGTKGGSPVEATRAAVRRRAATQFGARFS